MARPIPLAAPVTIATTVTSPIVRVPHIPYSTDRRHGGITVHLLCEPYDTIALGDHWLVVGLVIGTELGTSGGPLLYHQGRYGGFDPHPD
ncbi:MAG TPA: flavin reductase family protein [Actinoallomurus sp.]|nr:flavin reductase family protein [Actinoallomurus sp.]